MVFKKKDKINFKKRCNKKNTKELYSGKEVTIIMLLSLIIGFIICYVCLNIIVGKNYFTVVAELRKFIDTYYAIVDNYYGEFDKNNLIDKAIDGMISSVGDSFTVYIDTDDSQSFSETINGLYEGIGCSVITYSDGSIVIVDVFENSPSDKAGIKSGDMVIKVDGNSLDGKNSTYLSNYVKNCKNDKVILTIVRNNSELDVTVNLGKVEIPSVTGKIIKSNEKNIGYINVSLFANNTYKQFKSKLNELEKEQIEGLIIDVRDNSGGYLTSVTNICNLFLEKGKIVYQLEASKGIKKTKDTTREKRDYGIVVLINGGTASASEILASAIYESYGGYVVGTNSYGKGTVQETKKLLDGSMIKYTAQKWLTPQGKSIDGIGVVPSNYIELDSEYFENPSLSTDNQVNEAINLLIK